MARLTNFLVTDHLVLVTEGIFVLWVTVGLPSGPYMVLTCTVAAAAALPGKPATHSEHSFNMAGPVFRTLQFKCQKMNMPAFLRAMFWCLAGPLLALPVPMAD